MSLKESVPTYPTYPYSYCFTVHRKNYTDFLDKYSLRSLVRDLGAKVLAVPNPGNALTNHFVVLSPKRILDELKKMKPLEGLEIAECCYFGTDHDINFATLVAQSRRKPAANQYGWHQPDYDHWGD